MEFSTLVQLLHKYLSGHFKTNPDFLEKLLRHTYYDDIVDVDPFTDLNLSDEALSRAYSGNKQTVLTKKVAQFFMSNYNFELIEEYLADALNVAQTDELESELQASGIDTEYGDKTITQVCGQLLYDSIREIAEKPRGTKKATTKAASVDYMTECGNSLFIEARCQCPNDGCLNPLYKMAGNVSVNEYEVVKIDDKVTVSMDNLIALCPSCAFQYTMVHPDAVVKRMKVIKHQLVNTIEPLNINRDSSLQDDLARAVRKFAELPATTEIDLNYNPVTLDRKIPSDTLLRRRVSSNVSSWFTEIHGILKNVSAETNVNYDLLCSEIKTAWLKIRSDQRAQVDIYNGLTDWVANKINERHDLCEILVSYFIQNCEVFEDADSK